MKFAVGVAVALCAVAQTTNAGIVDSLLHGKKVRKDDGISRVSTVIGSSTHSTTSLSLSSCISTLTDRRSHSPTRLGWYQGFEALLSWSSWLSGGEHWI